MVKMFTRNYLSWIIVACATFFLICLYILPKTTENPVKAQYVKSCSLLHYYVKFIEKKKHINSSFVSSNHEVLFGVDDFGDTHSRIFCSDYIFGTISEPNETTFFLIFCGDDGAFSKSTKEFIKKFNEIPDSNKTSELLKLGDEKIKEIDDYYLIDAKDLILIKK
jgi:hypothetical protein